MADTISDGGEDVPLVPRPCIRKQKAPPRLRKATQPKKLAVVPRLEAVAASELGSACMKHAELGRCVHVWPLNVAVRDMQVNAHMEMATESRNLTPTCHFEVKESPPHGFDPGHDEKEGMALAAYDIARVLLGDRNAAVVVASKRGADATTFLVALATAALGRLDALAKKHVLGTKRGRGVKNPDLARIAKSFKEWSEVVGRHAINSNVV